MSLHDAATVSGLKEMIVVPPTNHEMLDAGNRQLALIKAVDCCLAEGNADGQTVIRRAVGFYKFLDGQIASGLKND